MLERLQSLREMASREQKKTNKQKAGRASLWVLHTEAAAKPSEYNIRLNGTYQKAK